MAGKSLQAIYEGNVSERELAVERLLATYDFALRALLEADVEGVLRVVRLLRKTLNYDAGPEIAVELDKLHLLTEEYLHAGKLAEAAEIIESLRHIWGSW